MTATLREGGLRLWYAVFGGIVAWMTHLVFLASFARYACTTHRMWVSHLVTGSTALATVGAMVLAYAYERAGANADPDADSVAGRLRFLGQFGLLVGAANLALILLEGSYVVFIPSCR